MAGVGGLRRGRSESGPAESEPAGAEAGEAVVGVEPVKASTSGAVHPGARGTEVAATSAMEAGSVLPGPCTEAGSHRARGRRVWGVVAAGLVTVAIGSGSVVIDALSAPGSDSAAAKLAEWARDHGLGPVITWLEAVTYEHSQPVVGGSPLGGIPIPGGAIPDSSVGGGGARATRVWPPAPPIAPLAGGKGLPGEGQWHTVVTSGGRPAVEVASLRPDDQHTSFVAAVMRIDPALVRGQLHPGTRDPGGSWRTPTHLIGADFANIAAVFNGGFRLNDPSHNGYYSEGRTVAALVAGKASLVLYQDGHADVGAWGREVRMAPEVASVRQNLLPLVDDAEVNPTCATGGSKEWGSTVGQAAFIHRSGFGVTASGEEVYVGGPSLSVCTLGRILVAAGVVRGMELDINPNWVSGAYFHDRAGAAPSGFRLFPGERVSAEHYLVASSRDWYSWSLRSGGEVAGPLSSQTQARPSGSQKDTGQSRRHLVTSGKSRQH